MELRQCALRALCAADLLKTVPRRALGPDVAAVAGDDAFDVGEADARAFEVLVVVEALKYPEQLVDILRIEAYTVVADEKREDRL